jgi:hypothetical protein
MYRQLLFQTQDFSKHFLPRKTGILVTNNIDCTNLVLYMD